MERPFFLPHWQIFAYLNNFFNKKQKRLIFSFDVDYCGLNFHCSKVNFNFQLPVLKMTCMHCNLKNLFSFFVLFSQVLLINFIHKTFLLQTSRGGFAVTAEWLSNWVLQSYWMPRCLSKETTGRVSESCWLNAHCLVAHGVNETWSLASWIKQRWLGWGCKPSWKNL